MVSEHAMLILMLLLAVAVVIIALTLALHVSKMAAQLNRLEGRIKGLSAEQDAPLP